MNPKVYIVAVIAGLAGLAFLFFGRSAGAAELPAFDEPAKPSTKDKITDLFKGAATAAVGEAAITAAGSAVSAVGSAVGSATATTAVAGETAAGSSLGALPTAGAFAAVGVYSAAVRENVENPAARAVLNPTVELAVAPFEALTNPGKFVDKLFGRGGRNTTITADDVDNFTQIGPNTVIFDATLVPLSDIVSQPFFYTNVRESTTPTGKPVILADRVITDNTG